METLIDYQSLDDALLEAIAAGNREMHELMSGAVRLEALKVAEFVRRGTPRRMVQRRLQALRVAGRIAFKRTAQTDPDRGWTVVARLETPEVLSIASRSLGRVAHDAAAKAGGWSRRWQYMSKSERQGWESIAAAVVQAHIERSTPSER